MIGSATAEFAPLEATLERRRLQVEEALRRLAVRARAPVVEAALEYSLFAPAKRLRPIVSLMVADLLRASPEPVLPAACAIEMVHTASLILDDLPCMDDAASRRGRPTCHVVHGEATAILAAFALQNRAFEILAEGWAGAPEAGVRATVARDLARAIGLDGMVAGQSVDLTTTDQAIDFQTLEFIHSRKTGALFTAAVRVGALVAGARPPLLHRLTTYGEQLGLCFQIVDDILDAVQAGDGRTDAALGKATYPAVLGMARARTHAEHARDRALAALAPLGARAEALRAVARVVVAQLDEAAPKASAR